MKPSIGRIVHFVSNEPGFEGSIIPAIIVNVWSDTCVNLLAFHDGSNSSETHGGTQWLTSISMDGNDKPANYTWHWPPPANKLT